MARSSASERDVIPHAEGTLDFDDDTIRGKKKITRNEKNCDEMYFEQILFYFGPGR